VSLPLRPDFAFVSLDAMAPAISARAKNERIESRDNRWLKRFRACLEGRPAKGGAAIGVEGPRLVAEALRSGLTVEAMLVSDSGERHLGLLKSLLPPSLQVLRTSDRLFASVAGTETPQGIAMLAAAPSWQMEHLLRDAPLLVVLAGVQDPGNVGTIVRAAEAFGASGVIACRGTAHPLSAKSVRASAGSIFRLPFLSGASPADLMDELRRHGVRQYAATLAEAQGPGNSELTAACAIWIGSEGAGLPAEIERGADARIRIALRPPVESLNAAAAATVFLYEAARQRGSMDSAAARSNAGERGQPAVAAPRKR
jgi:RNA methyltransferase, TrmH family